MAKKEKKESKKKFPIFWKVIFFLFFVAIFATILLSSIGSIDFTSHGGGPGIAAKRYFILMGSAFAVLILARIIFVIARHKDSKKANRKQAELEKQHQSEIEELNRRQTATQPVTQRVESQPVIVNCPPVQPQIQTIPIPTPQVVPVYVPVPIYVPPVIQQQPDYSTNIGSATGAYYTPAQPTPARVAPTPQPTYVEHNDYQRSAPYVSPALNTGAEQNYGSQTRYLPRNESSSNGDYPDVYPATHTDVDGLDVIDDSWISRYRDPQSPNIICYEYANCIRYYRQDAYGRLSFISERKK